jgi:KDO2-lipid IV(A) lauroyltransferase
VSRLQVVLDFAAYCAVRVAVCVLQSLPLETCRGWSHRLAWLLWHVVRLRRKVVEENLAIAFPHASAEERTRIALGMWSHLVLMIAEITHAPRKIHRTNWRSHLRMPQMAMMVPRLLDRRPTVIISGHLGNFEMGGYLLALHGFPTHTIARKLDNEYLDAWVNEFREATGQFMLPKAGCTEQIEELFDAGGTLVLLGDQYAGDSACWVDFFGKPASTHKAVAVFTLSGRAPTAIGGVYRAEGPMQFEMRVADVVDPDAPGFSLGTIPLLTQWYTAGLERLIRAAPDQYWWVHRRWKGAPARRGNRTPRPAAAA